MSKDFNDLHPLKVDKWSKMQIHDVIISAWQVLMETKKICIFLITRQWDDACYMLLKFFPLEQKDKFVVAI